MKKLDEILTEVLNEENARMMTMKSAKERIEGVKERIENDKALDKLISAMSNRLAFSILALRNKNMTEDLIKTMIAATIIVWEKANNRFNKQIKHE